MIDERMASGCPVPVSHARCASAREDPCLRERRPAATPDQRGIAMAYFDIDNMFAAPARRRAMEVSVAPDGETTGFSALEWSVIAVSRRDSLSSLEEPSRISRALGGLFGI